MSNNYLIFVQIIGILHMERLISLTLLRSHMPAVPFKSPFLGGIRNNIKNNLTLVEIFRILLVNLERNTKHGSSEKSKY